MLRMIQNASAAGAKSYYSTADYYAEGQELAGRWCGRAAAMLGLAGEVARRDWEALCDNRHPITGAALTLRTKANRTVGYDLNFHVPKSVSVLYGLTRDERILEAFRRSVDETMRDLEAEMKARVRKGGRHEDRTTGNLAWGEFIHFTSRPVDGIPDPHLHAHCFAFNVTWDGPERAWKAGQFRDLKRDAPYFQAVFHARLAGRLADDGYGIRRTAKGWEIEGVSDAVIDRFSRRRDLIERTAAEEGITNESEKDKLGARTREGKAKGLSEQELVSEWRSRLTPDEWSGLSSLRQQAVPGRRPPEGRGAEEAMEFAIAHCFERRSVVPERQLLAAALKASVGRATIEQVTRQAARSGVVVGTVRGRRMATTPGVLAEERRMVEFARRGRGTRRPLGDPDRPFARDWLEDDQQRAVRHVLSSRDRVILIRGAAGVGKTALMQEAAEGIRAGGREVFAFAPTAGASRGVLRAEGFGSADTVARLLAGGRLQERVRGQVIWIDEAGLVGSRTMAQVFDLAERADARVILSGDRRQHRSVERGSPLKLLEEEAGLIPAEVREIRRQTGEYKLAVRALSEGRAAEGFDRLDRLGWVRQIGEAERYQQLAADYIAAVRGGGTVLVVSPTHLEKDRITREIRRGLLDAGRLAGEERIVPTLISARLTAAQRTDPASYRPGDVLQFHQNAKGIRRGQRIEVAEARRLPLDRADRFDVFHRGAIALAPGDVIRITRNGTTADGGHALHNGDLHRVRGFSPEGDLILANGWRVAREFGHIDYGYAVTSHAAQGKTVDRVFVGQSSDSFPATSTEQFYVSCSRGRKSVTVYTDDKTALRAAIAEAEERLSASDLVAGDQRGSVRRRRQRRAEAERAAAVARNQERVEGRAYER